MAKICTRQRLMVAMELLIGSDLGFECAGRNQGNNACVLIGVSTASAAFLKGYEWSDESPRR
jgi:hypothetical protein